ncbi:cytochrome c553 [Bradyrhizobium sp. JR3.5]
MSVIDLSPRIRLFIRGRGAAAASSRPPIARWRVLAVLVSALAIGAASHGLAADSVQNKAEACTPCHGDNGVSTTENTPSLASQPDQFLQWQLVFFRSGARKNEVMDPIAEQLSNDDIRALGGYFASLKAADATAAKAPDDHPDLTEAGKQAAVAGRCAACHGDDFAGSKAVARVAGQREEYLVKALHDYKAGVRSGGGVAAMAEVAYPLSDQDIAALAHFLSRL